MKISKFFNFCFENAWRPILLWLFAIIILLVDRFINSYILSVISIWILALSMLCLFISIIYQLSKKQWLKGFLTGIVFFGSVSVIIVYTIFAFFIETIDGDGWADNLKIPEGIKIEYPIDLTADGQRPDSICNLIRSDQDFQLYNSFQPGQYEFDFWTGKIDSGTIYLKAFEITKEYGLSADRLKKSSEIRIYNSRDSVVKFSTNSDFTIYEGDWGKPYAARFEVWYIEDKSGLEKKLFTKNYFIEGWQR
ncbi:MAG: hypothetical protein ACK5D5_05600 [Bacteroidota bacterium]|jgi:hypothetical protein